MDASKSVFFGTHEADPRTLLYYAWWLEYLPFLQT